MFSLIECACIYIISCFIRSVIVIIILSNEFAAIFLLDFALYLISHIIHLQYLLYNFIILSYFIGDYDFTILLERTLTI